LMQHLTFVVLEVCLATRGRAIHIGTTDTGHAPGATATGALTTGPGAGIIGAGAADGTAPIDLGKDGSDSPSALEGLIPGLARDGLRDARKHGP
jgi:hypothetical protein